MGWGQTTRILLVWPQRANMLNRRLDLTLIKRHSTALGSQLALVTRDRNVRIQASELDIPVYKNVREAEQSRWRRPRKRRKRTNTTPISITYGERRRKLNLSVMREQAHPTTPRWLRNPVFRISVFTLGVLSMLVVAAIFIPSAEIFVTPTSKTEMVTIDVNASSDQKTVDLSGAVPAYLESVVVEGRDRTPATSETTIPRQTASGRATFDNLTDKEVNVPAGTVVSTQGDSPIRFATTKDVIIPAASMGVTIPIEAIQSGSIGNVPSEKIVAIEGPLGLNLSVINHLSTSGGSDYTTTTPNADDYQKVYDQLLSSLRETAQNEFELNANPGDISLSQNPIQHQALEESYTPEFGEPADHLDLSLRVEFKFPFADGADLYQLGQIVLERHISEDFTPRPETLKITQVTQPVSQPSGKSTWRIQASWQTGANLNETEAIAIILGLAPEQALQQLDDHSPIKAGTEIHLTPDWWPRLPVLPFRINIINVLETAPTSD